MSRSIDHKSPVLKSWKINDRIFLNVVLKNNIIISIKIKIIKKISNFIYSLISRLEDVKTVKIKNNAGLPWGLKHIGQ